MVTTIALDIGNANTKVIADGTGVIAERAIYPSQVKPISINEYRDIEADKTSDMSDYFIVNGDAFVIGDSAQKSLSESFLKATGSQRYRADKIGVAAAIAMRRVIKRDIKPRVIAAFPPVHRQYAQDLCAAIDNLWVVENMGKEITIDPADIFAIPEAVASYYNILLTKKGEYSRSHRARSFADQEVLVVDGGGYTLDVAPVNRNAEVDNSAIRSFEDVAAQNILFDFSKQVNSQYKRVLQGSKLDLWRYIEALQTGKLRAGIYGQLDVNDEAHRHRAKLFNQYLDAINVASGGANFDEIVFTGGASALIRDELTRHYGSANVSFTGEGENMVTANAEGMHAFLKFAIANGV